MDVTTQSRKVCGVKLTPQQVYDLHREIEEARQNQHSGRNLFERIRDGITSRSCFFGRGEYTRGDIHLL